MEKKLYCAVIDDPLMDSPLVYHFKAPDRASVEEAAKNLVGEEIGFDLKLTENNFFLFEVDDVVEV